MFISTIYVTDLNDFPPFPIRSFINSILFSHQIFYSKQIFYYILAFLPSNRLFRQIVYSARESMTIGDALQSSRRIRKHFPCGVHIFRRKKTLIEKHPTINGEIFEGSSLERKHRLKNHPFCSSCAYETQVNMKAARAESSTIRTSLCTMQHLYF